MNITQAIKMSAKSIFSNKARSALTMLGIIIGLAAVIILVSYAQGQNLAMQRYYESMGNNKINVECYGWSNEDISQALYDYCLSLDNIAGISPSGRINSSPPIKYGSKTLSPPDYSSMYIGGGAAISIGGSSGVVDNYPTISLGNDQFSLCNDYKIAKGRDLSYLDVKNGNQVCVLGSATAEALFNFADPIGQTITISGMPFRVVGVYESKVGKSTGGTEENQWIEESIARLDRLVLLPSTMTRYFNDNQPITSFVVKVNASKDIPLAITNLSNFLKARLGEGRFSVYSESVWQDEQNEASKMQQNFLGGIAAISLLVGGIGIMNIMLVTVTERTREIGIRKAIGAERRSIIVQFLIEAAMICGIGGLFGIAVGYIGTLIVGKLSFNTILIPSPGVTLGAAAISVALGIIFGMYPAIKASGLQPVVALRAD